jgi:hypothetical protein
MSADVWGVVKVTKGTTVTAGYVGGIYPFERKVRAVDSDVAGNLDVHLIGDADGVWTTIRVRANEPLTLYQFDKIKSTSTLVLANVLFGH